MVPVVVHAEQHFYAQFTNWSSATASQFKFSSRSQLDFDNSPAKNSKLEVTCNPYWLACDKVCARHVRVNGA